MTYRFVIGTCLEIRDILSRKHIYKEFSYDKVV